MWGKAGSVGEGVGGDGDGDGSGDGDGGKDECGCEEMNHPGTNDLGTNHTRYESPPDANHTRYEPPGTNQPVRTTRYEPPIVAMLTNNNWDL